MTIADLRDRIEALFQYSELGQPIAYGPGDVPYDTVTTDEFRDDIACLLDLEEQLMLYRANHPGNRLVWRKFPELGHQYDVAKGATYRGYCRLRIDHVPPTYDLIGALLEAKRA